MLNAAEQGHMVGQSDLGWCYFYGVISKQPSIGLVKAVEQGYIDAQVRFGDRHHNGDGGSGLS